MLIGILSDSHNNHTNLLYALDIFRTLGVRILMHAGDLTLDVMLEDFKDFDLYLAFGNGDDPEMITIRARKISKRFVCGETLDLCLENRKIFVLHGDNKALLEKRINSGEYNYVIHGHTHCFRDEQLSSTRVINSGALGGRFTAERSFATLDPAKNELQRYLVP